MKCKDREKITYLEGNYFCNYSSIQSINHFSVCYYCTFPNKENDNENSVKGED